MRSKGYFLPDTVVDLSAYVGRKYLRNNYGGVDPLQLRPLDTVREHGAVLADLPCHVLAAESDDYISAAQGMEVAEGYAGECSYSTFPGGHFGARPKHVVLGLRHRIMGKLNIREDDPDARNGEAICTSTSATSATSSDAATTATAPSDGCGAAADTGTYASTTATSAGDDNHTSIDTVILDIDDCSDDGDIPTIDSSILEAVGTISGCSSDAVATSNACVSSDSNSIIACPENNSL